MKLVGELLGGKTLNKSDDVIDLGSGVVDMEPYKVKDISNFYFRDHPKGLNPSTPRYKKYWLDFARDSIEGKWVDDEGTWYWIPPKSFFYINYLTLEDAKRNPIHPHYRDIDRIIGRYVTCCDGFSGFEFDDDYTCNKLVKEKIDGTLRAVKEKDITENCYNSVTGELKVYIDPWEYLMRHYLIDYPAEKPLGRALWENPVQNMMILSGRGVGKALRKTEKVRVVNGWTEIQNLKIGDKVYGGDGLLTNVTDVFGGQEDLSFYKFTLSDGRTIDSCEDHQWKVFDRRKTNGPGKKRGGYVVKTTKDLLPFYKNERVDSKYRAKHGVDKYINEYRFAIPLAGSLSSDHNDVTIDPYTLGLFLGDGCITGKRGSSINLTSADDEIINYVYNKHPELDYKKITEVKNHKKISFGEAQNSFRTNLNDYGLLGTYSDTKFIPTEYLHNTEEVKLELLKGLMDTDGWSNDRGVIEYYTVSNQLADDVEYLIRSLGMGCHRSIKPSHYKKGGLRVDCKDCHRLMIFTDEAVFKLERKLKYLGHIKSKAGQSKKEKTFITNIEYIGKEDGVCIKVDNKDHTFITKDHIVTHNSTSVFIGDFMHEWLFCGVQRYEEFFTDSQRKYLFAMASADSANLNRSVSLIDSNMTRLPGRYRYPVTDDGSVPDYFGPYYKNFIGTWKVGQTVRHVEKDASGNITTVGSVSQIRVITPDKTKIVAGDRFRRIYIEEVGFQENIMEVHANSVDSLKLNGERVGSAVYLGCVCKGSKVWDKNGNLISIEDVSKETGIIGFDQEKGISVGQKVIHINPPQQKECIYIKTDSGRFIQCSTDHPICTRERYVSGHKHLKKKAIWAEAGTIFKGEAIGVVDSVEIWGNETLFDPWLVGMMIGDGTYGEGQNARLASADDEVWDYISDKYTVKYSHKAPTKDGRTLRKGRILKLAPKLEEIGIRGQVSVHKRLPKSIFSCNKETVCKLVGGYYDADGCISIGRNNYCTIKLTSISLPLIEGVQSLLGKMGIHGKIREEKIPPLGTHTPYSLYIKDRRSILSFAENIPLKVGYKKDRLSKMADIKRGTSDNYYFDKYKGLRWEKVVEIVNLGRQDVYNLAAGDTHTYTVNGFHTHNTSGDIKAFRQANDLFNNPETYDIFGVKNYWSNSTKPIGLFIPAYYSQRDYSDVNHNTDIVEAFKYIIQTRKKARETASSMAYAKMVMYNPVEPKEMMRPSGDSILPKQEAQDAHTKLEVYDLFRKRAIIGSLFYDKSVDRGVRFKHDLENKLHPITTYDTTHYPNTEGALILYETPLSAPPKDLYWIVYDPAAQSGTGTSLHSIIVYKYSFSGNDNSLEDTIVAEWLGRLPTLEENWNMVLMVARYFDAKIFPEYNTPGFLDWCSQRKLFNYLQPENMALKKEINPRAKSSAWRKGFRMDARAKGWALNKLRDWLLEVKERDENGIPTKRIIDTIYSPRILEEIIYFDPDDGNYDHISSLLGLMILHNALNNIPKPKVVDKWSEDDYFYTNEESIEYVTPHTRRARASILNF